MTIERTQDLTLVRAILTLPSIYQWISDDGSPDRESYEPPRDERIVWILAHDEKGLIGLWMLAPQNAIEYEVHTTLLPKHGYQRGRRAAQETKAWIWANTPARRLITKVPAFNRIAYKFALDAGFELIGIDRQSFLKNGNLYDQAILGLSPSE